MMKFVVFLVAIVVLAGGAYIYFEKSVEDEAVRKTANRADEIKRQLALCAPNELCDIKALEDFYRVANAIPAFTARSPFKNFRNEALYYIYLKSYSRGYTIFAYEIQKNSSTELDYSAIFVECKECKSGKLHCNVCNNSKVCTLCKGRGVRKLPGGGWSTQGEVSCSKTCTFCPTESSCSACDNTGQIADKNKLNEILISQYRKLTDLLDAISAANKN